MPTASELNLEGAEFYLKGDHEGARLHYLAALEINPNYSLALGNLGKDCSEHNKLHGALAYFRRAVQIEPKNSKLWNNLGNTLMRLNKYDNAEEAFKTALYYAVENSDIYYNLGLTCYRQGKFREAREYFDKVVALGNWNQGIQNDLAHVHLSLGDDLSNALALYESRWFTLIHLQPWDFHVSEWQGEKLGGKKLLLHGEQGFGDDIMLFRLVKNLRELGANVSVASHSSLIKLFQAQDVETFDIIKVDSQIMHQFDFQSPMFGALRHLNLNWKDINGASYLRYPRKKKFNFPNCENLFKVGICWASGRRNSWVDWRRRYAPLEHWLTLACIPQVKLVSLQLGIEREEISNLGVDGLIIDQTNKISNWADTADLIAGLDLVIAVDTAVAHLSAALGKETWMLSQYSRCWRWQGLDSGTGWPWYDSMKAFGQKTPDDWKTQLDDCRDLLEARLVKNSLAAD